MVIRVIFVRFITVKNNSVSCFCGDMFFAVDERKSAFNNMSYKQTLIIASFKMITFNTEKMTCAGRIIV